MYFQKTASNVILTPPRAPKMNHVAQPTKTGQSAQTGQTSNKSSTFPRIQTPNKTKPPPSPSRDSKTSFSIDQSKTEDFTWDAFGPSSQEVFETAFTRHKDFSRLSDKVLKQGTKMKTNVWDVTGKPGETMTYEQLLQGMYKIAVERFQPNKIQKSPSQNTYARLNARTYADLNIFHKIATERWYRVNASTLANIHVVGIHILIIFL